MKDKIFSKLLMFLERLDKAKITYTMEHSRDEAVMVNLVVPGEYWEIEFLEDGAIEVECYRSNGKICDESVLDEMIAKNAWDALPQPEEAVNQP
jgi:hypothetical protein